MMKTLLAMRPSPGLLPTSPQLPVISVELEKQRKGENLLELATLADVVLVSREWARANHFPDAASCILHVSKVGLCRIQFINLCAHGNPLNIRI